MSVQSLAKKIVRKGSTGIRLLSWTFGRTFRKFATVSTRQGIFTLSFADEVISKTLYCSRECDLDLISGTLNFLRSSRRCPPRGEGTLVDIGANNGVISIGALYTGEFARAVAIEPDPLNFSLLRRNVDQNDLSDRMICLPVAASDQTGELVFELSRTNFGDHRVRKNPENASSSPELWDESDRRVITVRSDRLDNLLSTVAEPFAKTIAVIWVDVQGHEGFVFRGAESVFARGVPVVSEIWPYGIARSGMTSEQFYEIVESFWTEYCVIRKGQFERYGMQTFREYYAGLGATEGNFQNVIFLA
jgi:FkbM family methyltransferase